MTTILVRNADFSGAPLYGYRPPVDGASLCAFVGDERAYLRNFGSGDDLAIGAGNPQPVDAAFRRFSAGDYLVSPSYRTEATTLIVVARKVGTSGFANPMSAERNADDGGRRGIALNLDNANSRMTATVYGTSGGANTTLTSYVTADTNPGFYAATYRPDSSSGTRTTAYRLTEAVGTGANSLSTNATMEPTDDEDEFPFVIGATHRSFSSQEVDIGFVAAYPRVLTTAELALIHASVAKRFEALGFLI